MDSRLSMSEAKARLSRVIDAAEHRGQHTIVLRHGKPAAAVVSMEDLKLLENLRRTEPNKGLLGLQALHDDNGEWIDLALAARESSRRETPPSAPSLEQA